MMGHRPFHGGYKCRLCGMKLRPLSRTAFMQVCECHPWNVIDDVIPWGVFE